MAKTKATLLGVNRFVRLFAPPGPFGGVLWFTLRGEDFFSERYTRLHRGDVENATPVELRAQAGRWLREFVANTRSLVVISEKLEAELQKVGLTGWRRYPVKLYDTKDCYISSKYVGLGIVGRAGPLDRSCVTKTKRLADGREVVVGQKGIAFDPNSWDGSDIFLLADRPHVIVTKHFVEVLKSTKAKGWLAEQLFKYAL